MAHKKNYRKVPYNLLKKIEGFTNKNIIAACVRKIPASDLLAGKFSHAGLTIENGQLRCGGHFIPPKSRGRFSKYNFEGRTIIRKDVPKIWRTWYVPNFGDWMKGSHGVTKLVYRRDFVPPRELELTVEILQSEGNSAEPFYLIRFGVAEVLNSESADFEERLLENVNLLQENVGAADVFPSDASRAQFLASVHVHWELLPVGEGDALVRRLLAGVRKDRDQLARKIDERRRFLETLGPTRWIEGSSGFRRYFGAQFRDDLVVFENIEFGNAVYVMFGDWRVLSALSRLELLASEHSFERVVHRSGWRVRLAQIIMNRLEGPEGRAAA